MGLVIVIFRVLMIHECSVMVPSLPFHPEDTKEDRRNLRNWPACPLATDKQFGQVGHLRGTQHSGSQRFSQRPDCSAKQNHILYEELPYCGSVANRVSN